MKNKGALIVAVIIGIIMGGILGIKASHVSVDSQPLAKTSPTLPLTQIKNDFCLDVPVLFYHHIQPLDKADEFGERSLTVAPQNFQRHIAYLLNKGYTIVSLGELVAHLRNRLKMEKTVVITLDDGYEDNYIYAYPIAKKYNIPITIAAPTWYVGRFERHLTWKQIKEMYLSGNVHFVSHSFSHRSLAIDDDDEVLDQQINEPLKALENTLGKQSKILVYPYGRYNDHVMKYLEKIGYQAAFTVEKGTYHCLSTIFHLPRLRIWNAGPSVYGI